VPKLERLRDSLIMTLLRETDIRPAEMSLLTAGNCDRRRALLEPEPGRRVMLNGFAARQLEEYLAAIDSYARLTPASPLFVEMSTGALLPESYCWDLICRDLRLVAGTASARASVRSAV
jgi:site-specific recombinase XerD